MNMNRRTQLYARLLVPTVAAIPLSAAVTTGCGDEDSGDQETDSDVTPYEARSEAVLEVQNESSPIDLLSATETQDVQFGLEGDNLLLEANEPQNNARYSAVAADDGDSLLLSANEYTVTFSRTTGEERGTVTLLDAQENVIAEQEDVLLEGTEQTTLKQNSAGTISEKLAAAQSQWSNGRWNSLIQAANQLADTNAQSEAAGLSNALSAMETSLTGGLLSVSTVYEEATPNAPTAPGSNPRPNLFRIPSDNTTFATDFGFDSLLNASDRQATRSFFDDASSELKGIASGTTDAPQTLPSQLEDAEGNALSLTPGVTSLRVSIRWEDAVNVDLSVVAPSGEAVDPGEADIGPGASENVLFANADDGLYRAQATHAGGEQPALFEMTIYENGRIVGLISEVLQPGQTSTTIVVRVGDEPRSESDSLALSREACEFLVQCAYYSEIYVTEEECVEFYENALVGEGQYYSAATDGQACADSYARLIDCYRDALIAADSCNSYLGCYDEDEAFLANCDVDYNYY